MLKSIDVLIGLVVVLLALSMAVTVITQCVTAIINSRGRHLRRGLVDLLQQLDPGLTAAVSDAVATRLLSHPLVSGSNTPLAAYVPGSGAVMTAIRRALGGARLGNVVHREEFTKLLMHLATDGPSGLDAQTMTALKTALRDNGIPDPEATLKDIRMAALRLEQVNPDLSNVARQNLAILQKAESEFVAKINNWYDQTMDRTSQRFTASTRAITFGGAILIAIGLQVDTVSLVNRLSADDKLRAALVDQAFVVNRDGAPTSQLSNQASAVTPVASTDKDRAQRYDSFLAEYGLVKLPSSNFNEWWTSLKNANYLGVLITALLLSLGAPFWFSALSSLLQLRSVLAVKDDAQRARRQSSPPPAENTPAGGTPSDGGQASG